MDVLLFGEPFLVSVDESIDSLTKKTDDILALASDINAVSRSRMTHEIRRAKISFFEEIEEMRASKRDRPLIQSRVAEMASHIDGIYQRALLEDARARKSRCAAIRALGSPIPSYTPMAHRSYTIVGSPSAPLSKPPSYYHPTTLKTLESIFKTGSICRRDQGVFISTRPEKFIGEVTIVLHPDALWKQAKPEHATCFTSPKNLTYCWTHIGDVDLSKIEKIAVKCGPWAKLSEIRDIIHRWAGKEIEVIDFESLDTEVGASIPGHWSFEVRKE